MARGFRMGGTDQPFTGYLTTVSAGRLAAPHRVLAINLQCGLQSEAVGDAEASRAVTTPPNAQFPNANAQGVPQFKSEFGLELRSRREGRILRSPAARSALMFTTSAGPALSSRPMSAASGTQSKTGVTARILGSEAGGLYLKLPAGFSSKLAIWALADSKFLTDSAITGYQKSTAIPRFAEESPRR